MQQNISKTLIKWYEANKRDLPWRDISDPYRIWISEIILQQTRVNQGMEYYLRFVERFPTVKDLAQAPEDEVLKYWQGLGYYSRARNLHKTAQIIVKNYNAEFPCTHADILKLKGIGDYTAAAISSFAFNLPHAVVDGNVYRVLSRIFGIETPIDSTAGKKEFAKIASDLLNPNLPATHNQAIMEFGALQCIPVKPDCQICTLKHCCKAYALAVTDMLPVKQSKIKVRIRHFNYLFIKSGSNTYLRQRTLNDVWKQLYEFPLIEAENLLTIDQIAQSNLLSGINELFIKSEVQDFKHILSHQRIYARFFSIEINSSDFKQQDSFSIALKDLHKFPVSRLMELFIQNAEI